MRILIKGVLVAFVLCLWLAGPVDAGQLEDATAAIQRGDYATALRLLRPMAEQGNAEAQYWLGVMYGLGDGVPPNRVVANAWYRKAADQGFAPAEYNLGTYGDPSEAAKWYGKAAEQGFADAQLALGYMYKNGRGVPQDYAAAAAWYRKAAVQGDYIAQTELGYMYASGQGVPQNAAAAMTWFREAADQSNCHTDSDVVVFRGTASAQAHCSPPSLAEPEFPGGDEPLHSVDVLLQDALSAFRPDRASAIGRRRVVQSRPLRVKGGSDRSPYAMAA